MDNNLDYRVTQLEGEMKEIGSDVKLILVNHLPHIQTDLMRLSITLKIFGGLILSALSALIAIAIT